jgi:hypothetical protein
MKKKEKEKEKLIRSMDRVEDEFFARPRERRQLSDAPESIGAMIADKIIDTLERAAKAKRSRPATRKKMREKSAA